MGLVPEIREFVRLSKARLAVSLHATTDEVRNWIVPVNLRHNLAELLSTLEDLCPATGSGFVVIECDPVTFANPCLHQHSSVLLWKVAMFEQMCASAACDAHLHVEPSLNILSEVGKQRVWEWGGCPVYMRMQWCFCHGSYKVLVVQVRTIEGCERQSRGCRGVRG